MLIGQKIGLAYLVPVALAILETNPLAESDFYKGDLLASIAALPESFWIKHPILNNQAVEIKNELAIIAGTIAEELLTSLNSRQYQ